MTHMTHDPTPPTTTELADRLQVHMAAAGRPIRGGVAHNAAAGYVNVPADALAHLLDEVPGNDDKLDAHRDLAASAAESIARSLVAAAREIEATAADMRTGSTGTHVTAAMNVIMVAAQATPSGSDLYRLLAHAEAADAVERGER